MLAFAACATLPLRGSKLAIAALPATPRGPAAAPSAPRIQRVRMVLTEDTEKETRPVRISGNNITVTDALRSHITDKLGKVVRRFPSIITKMDVHLTVEYNPSVPNRHKAEVVAFAGRTILRTEVRSDDMYAAIDAVEDRIGRTIRKFKERKEAKQKSQVGSANGLPVESDDEEDEPDEPFQDVYQDSAPIVPSVTAVVKKKVFPMPLQTVEEAVLCCEYVDHPWYLFRNAATNEISLVYKRNHGGYGLIEPSNPEAVDDEPV